MNTSALRTMAILLMAGAFTATPAADVTYYRAVDLGPAQLIDDLGLIQGQRHLVVQANNHEIRIFAMTDSSATLSGTITTPVSPGWGHMLTTVPDIDSDGVRDIATYEVGANNTFYMLSGNQQGGASVDAASAAIRTTAFDQVTPRYASSKPGTGEFLLAEFPDTIRRRDAQTGAILQTITGAGIANGGTWIGDYDDDEVPDFLTGAGNTGASPLYVISGADIQDGTAASRAILTLSDPLTPGLGYAADGNNIAASFGDINGDGISEIAVGSRVYLFDVNNRDHGRVVVFDGATGNVLYRIDSDQSYPDWVTYFGNNIVSTGDLDSDGKADFLVSARGYQSDGRATQPFDGAVIAYSGLDGGEIFRFYGDAEGTGDHELVALNDLNADGVMDLGVGSLSNGAIWLSHIAGLAPVPFSFTAQADVALSSQITSDTVTISGLSAPVAIAVTGAGTSAYSINGGAFSSTPGTISNGSTVAVRHTSAAAGATQTSTTLTIGGVSGTFTSTTADTTPNAFTFADQTGVPLAMMVTSAPVTIAGLTGAAAVSIVDGEYSVGCTATYVSTPGTVSNNQTICVRRLSAATNSTATSTTITIGGVTDTFTITTVAASSGGGGGGGGALDGMSVLALGLLGWLRRKAGD